MKNDNQTPEQLLQSYSTELSAKVGVFHSAYGFYPVSPASDAYQTMSANERNFSAAFFNHERITFLVTLMDLWDQLIHLRKSGAH